MTRDFPDPIAAEIAQEAKLDLRRDIAMCKSNLTHLSHSEMWVSINVNGAETFHEKADVVYEYTPAERRTFDYPGYPASVELLHVYVGETDIIKLMSNEALRELAETLV